MTETTEPKSERVDLRMTPAAKRTLQRAAAVNDKTLTEFVLDSSLTAAFDTLADRRVFQLDEVQWAAFMAALDMPPSAPRAHASAILVHNSRASCRGSFRTCHSASINELDKTSHRRGDRKSSEKARRAHRADPGLGARGAAQDRETLRVTSRPASRPCRISGLDMAFFVSLHQEFRRIESC
jgi:uncharacterized protein (DUF1778 family)